MHVQRVLLGKHQDVYSSGICTAYYSVRLNIQLNLSTHRVMASNNRNYHPSIPLSIQWIYETDTDCGDDCGVRPQPAGREASNHCNYPRRTQTEKLSAAIRSHGTR